MLKKLWLSVWSVTLVGCGAAPVHLVDGEGSAYRCGKDRGAFLNANGTVAVCMSQDTAEFVMCATAIGAGDAVASDDVSTSAGADLGDVGGVNAKRIEARKRSAKETASAEVLAARAEALRACTAMLQASRGVSPTVSASTGANPSAPPAGAPDEL